MRCKASASALFVKHRWAEPSLDGSVELHRGCGSEDAAEQGSTEDIIKTQINGHNLERDSARVRVIISLVSCAATESKHCKH